MPTPKVPPREWLAVVLPPAFALIVVSAAGVDAASTAHGWLAFGCAVAGGVVPPLVYTVVLAKEGRLFLRDAEEIRRSRARIMAVAIPSSPSSAGRFSASGLAYWRSSCAYGARNGELSRR